jgi:hypothetical protein
VVVNVPAQLRRRRHLNDDPARRQRKIWVTSALVAALVLLAFLGSLFWSYRYHSSIAAWSNAVTAALPSSKSLETPAVGTPSTAVASDAPAATMLCGVTPDGGARSGGARRLRPTCR